ncbi:MAG: geranylgeranylglycerol-phosphate geranylgeranyltransferase [Bacteroidia bacterium]
MLISLLAYGLACYIAASKSYGFLFNSEYYPQFWATAFTIVMIAATGYWINDVYDFKIDRLNKPDQTIVNAFLSVKKVLTIYFASTFLIASFSIIYLAWYKGEYQITIINLLSIALLFLYASYLKRISVVGNLVIALLVSFVIFLGGYVWNIMNTELIYTAMFAFIVTMLREITKDIEDIRGDLAFSLQTLPIQIGITATKKVLWVLYGIFLFACYLPFIIEAYTKGVWLWEYLTVSIILVQLPTIYIFLLMRRAQVPADYALQSRYLKLLMFGGMVSVFFLG